VPAEVYVLEKFSPQERGLIDEAVERASEAVLDIIVNGVERAMTEYNR